MAVFPQLIGLKYDAVCVCWRLSTVFTVCDVSYARMATAETVQRGSLSNQEWQPAVGSAALAAFGEETRLCQSNWQQFV